MGNNGVIHGIEFKLLSTGSRINRVHEKSGVVEGYFYITNLDSSLRFPLPEFVIGVLADFGIAHS